MLCEKPLKRVQLNFKSLEAHPNYVKDAAKCIHQVGVLVA